MSALFRPAPTVGRGMQDHHQDVQEKIDVSPSLLNRIRVQRGKPDLDLSLCSLGPKVPLDSIRENHGEVTSLNLSYNRIRSLSSMFVSELSSLQSLELSHNELKRLPDNFGELSQLVYLDVSQNKLQKLPLSMGKMIRLHYLNIQDNPFRAPLCEFLEMEKRRSTDGHMAAAHTAQTVVSFLAKLAKETMIMSSGDHPLPVRRRGVTFENDNFQEEEEEMVVVEEKNEEDVKNNNGYGETYYGGNLRRDELCVDAEMAGGHHLLQMVNYDKPEEPEVKGGLYNYFTAKHFKNDSVFPVPVVGKSSSFVLAHRQLKQGFWSKQRTAGMILSLFLVLIIPLMGALFFSSSSVDKYAKDNDLFNFYWGELKPIYEATESTISYITSRPFLVQQKGKLLDDVNPFTAMFMALKEALTSMFRTVARMFHSGAGARIV